VSNDAHNPRISKAIKAAIEKPLRFYFAVPSIDLTNWLVVEAEIPSNRWVSCLAQRRKRGVSPTF
jgi:hypothetical protein